MRASHIDFAPVAVIEPHLLRAPAIDERGMVRLAGFFPSKPERVNFDLAFQIVDGQWRMLGIGLNTSPEEPIASAAAPTQVEPAQPDASRQVADLERAAAATNTTPPIPRLRPAL